MFDGSGAGGVVLDEWWREFGDPVLDALVERALAENRDIAAAAARVVEARALAGRADAAGLPDLGLAAERQWLYASRQAPGLAGAGVRTGLVQREQDVHRVGINASWELDVFGAVARRVEAADAGAEAALATLRGVELMVAAETSRSYLALRVAERRRGDRPRAGGVPARLGGSRRGSARGGGSPRWMRCAPRALRSMTRVPGRI